jgi:hypothetical protein
MILSNLDEYTQALLKTVIRGSRLLHADKTLVIYSIENRHAARFWLTDSRWCVKENPWFEGYLEKGPLILLQSLRRSRDYLLAPADGEFRNRRNKRVSLRHFIAHHESAAAPLRSIGVYWHSPDTEGDWAEQICYCAPHGSSYYLAHQMRDCAYQRKEK